jgi:site-specific DNA recombinase
LTKKKAVLYARISYDRTGEAVGVNRQLHDLREIASQQGLEVVEEIQENDTSAYADRPGFKKVCKMAASGAVSHVLVWQSSRLMRSRRDRAEVISTFGKYNVSVIAAKGPSMDLSTAYGRAAADLMTSFDSIESEVKSERVVASIADGARRGRPWGSVPYGWTRTDGAQIVDEEQAAIVREATKRLLAGDSIRGLAADFNARGVPTPGGKEWTGSTVRQLVRRLANIGVRSYNGVEMPGGWPAIVEESKYRRVVALLNSRPARNGARPGARVHLLTHGIGQCGVCGSMLRAAKRERPKDVLIYMCSSPQGCVGRRMDGVDELVRQVVIGRLQMDDALGWLLGDDEIAHAAAEKVVGLELRLDEAADAYATGSLTLRQLEAITTRLRPEIETARRERDSAAQALDLDVVRELAGPRAQQKWDEMSVSSRRMLLQTLKVRVLIHKRVKHGPGFEPESVEIVWD